MSIEQRTTKKGFQRKDRIKKSYEEKERKENTIIKEKSQRIEEAKKQTGWSRK